MWKLSFPFNNPMIPVQIIQFIYSTTYLFKNPHPENLKVKKIPFFLTYIYTYLGTAIIYQVTGGGWSPAYKADDPRSWRNECEGRAQMLADILHEWKRKYEDLEWIGFPASGWPSVWTESTCPVQDFKVFCTRQFFCIRQFCIRQFCIESMILRKPDIKGVGHAGNHPRPRMAK